jgi:hypothetical protein
LGNIIPTDGQAQTGEELRQRSRVIVFVVERPEEVGDLAKWIDQSRRRPEAEDSINSMNRNRERMAPIGIEDPDFWYV